MADLGKLSQPELGNAGWGLINALSGGKGANGFSLGSLRPEDFGMDQNQMLSILRKYDPNASFTEYNYGNEGGNTTTESALNFDVSKLPTDFARDKNAVNLNSAGVKFNQDGTPDTGDLYQKNDVKKDPLFGYYTPAQNSKYRTQNSQVGDIMANYIMPLVLGWAGTAAMGPLMGGLPNALMGGMRNAVNGNWLGAGLSAAGAGLNAAGVSPWITGAGKSLASYAMGGRR